MATTAGNYSNVDAFFSTQKPNLAGNTINSGDFLFEDNFYLNSTYDAKALDSDAHGAYLIGWSNDTYPIGAYNINGGAGNAGNPGQEPAAPPRGMNVQRVGRVLRNTVAGQTYFPGKPVYYSTDAQTVTATAGTNILGYVANPADGSYKGGIAGGTTVQILVDVRAKWPTL